MHQLLSGRRDHGGFTLIEVLVAAALLAVGILFVSTMFPVGYSNVDAGGEQTEAAILAQDMLEKIKNARWEDVDNFGICPGSANISDCLADTRSTKASTFSTGLPLADGQLTEWKGAIESRVRAGVGTVQVSVLTPPAPSSSVATVIVSVQFSQGIRGTKKVTMGTRISE